MASVEPTPRFLDDDEPAASTLRLRRGVLLERLKAFHVATERAELQRCLEQLRAELADNCGVLHAAHDDEGVAHFVAATLNDALDQIGAAQTLERARYYAERLARAASGERLGSVNEIDLNRWKEYDDILTDSLWLIERRDSSGAHSADYWGNFVPQIPNQLMRRYTRRGDWVIDPFAGSGTTLIEGQRLGRNTLGVELQPTMVARARAAAEAEPRRYPVVCEVEQGDSACVDFGALLERHGANAAQLVLLHPPYHDIIRFSDDPRDLSNAGSVEGFLALLGRVVAGAAAVLDAGRYLALVIGDTYSRGEWTPLGFLAMQAIQERGFLLKSIVVKDINGTAGKRAQKELWRYRALVGGFYVFRHEYVFVFKKRG